MFQGLSAGGLVSFVYSIASSSYPDDVIVMKVFGETSARIFDHAGEYVLLKYLTQYHPQIVQLYCK